MRTPVHVVGGFLGTGKTTVLVHELAAREGRERCAVVVNDFGTAQIDATLLGGNLKVTNIPGGCVCCTAPEGLAAAIAAILDELAPDRVFIEPSGLARPRDVVDMLSRGALAHRIELMPTVVLVDPAATPDAHLLGEQLDAADVLVANRCDLADTDQLRAFDEMAAKLWPAPVTVIRTSRGRLPPEAWAWPPGSGPRAHEPAEHHHASTEGYTARSWVFAPDAMFSWDRVRAAAITPGIVRWKGVFRCDLGWYRLDVAGNQVHAASTAYRRDSRADVIAAEGFDFTALDAALAAARLADAANNPWDGEVLNLVDVDGNEFPLTRGALSALPGQVPDVSVLVPGRRGSGVRLAEVLALADGPQFIAAASDGLTTEPADVLAVGDAVVVHSLDGGPLPAEEGGPYRLYTTLGSNCKNVKGLARLRVLRA